MKLNVFVDLEQLKLDIKIQKRKEFIENILK